MTKGEDLLWGDQERQAGVVGGLSAFLLQEEVCRLLLLQLQANDGTIKNCYPSIPVFLYFILTLLSVLPQNC